MGDKLLDPLVGSKRSGNTRFLISGNCMLPLIKDKDVVEVQVRSTYWPGDIIVFKASNGQLFAHRTLGLYRKQGAWKFITASDTGRVDAAITNKQIIGRVVSGFCCKKAFEISLVTRCSAFLRYLRYSNQQLFKKLLYELN